MVGDAFAICINIMGQVANGKHYFFMKYARTLSTEHINKTFNKIYYLCCGYYELCQENNLTMFNLQNVGPSPLQSILQSGPGKYHSFNLLLPIKNYRESGLGSGVAGRDQVSDFRHKFSKLTKPNEHPLLTVNRILRSSTNCT